MTAEAPLPDLAAKTDLEPIVRDLRVEDLEEVIRIDSLHTGHEKSMYWRDLLDRFVGDPSGKEVGLAAEEPGGQLAGYLLGEVRAFEFGSEECGWVFAVGVEPHRLRSHVASRLLSEACCRLHAAGVDTIRTMVRRADVPVQSFFRAAGFEGGSFVQLERNLEEEV